MAIICKYKFNSSLCTDYLPEFNSEFTGYTKTDVDNGDNTITRTIEHDTLLPTLIRFGATGNATDRERSLLELIECNTTNVTNMGNMFSNCVSLTSLDLSNFDTSKVTNMENTFKNCSSLTSLNISNFNTSKVKDMSSMFTNCTSLTTLDLSNFDTSNVTNISNMFANCNKLTSLDLSNFDTSKVTTMGGIFNNCISLTLLDISNFDTSKVTDMSWMFTNCRLLTTLDLSNFDTSSVTSMSRMLCNCSSLITLNLSNFNTSNVTNMRDMFSSCTSLTSLDLSNFNTSKVTSMNSMFYNCNKLASLNISNFNTTNTTDMSGMFYNCSSLTLLDVSNFNTSNVTDISNIFKNTPKLADIGMVYCTKSTIDKISPLVKHTCNIYVNSVIPDDCTPVDGITFIYDGDTREMNHEPLRAVGDVKDRYVLIDGKWYIERNCAEVVLDGSSDEGWIGGINGVVPNLSNTNRYYINLGDDCKLSSNSIIGVISDNFVSYAENDIGDFPSCWTNTSGNLSIRILKSKLASNDNNGLRLYLQSNPTTFIYQLASPTYEPIDYNPFEVYNEVTHISNNSTIPCNMTIKNTGYNCLLKPNTTYTVSSNLGLNVVTTPNVLTEDCLRFYDTDTSTVTKMKDVMVLEGDWTTGKPLPSHFSGIESAFEQEYDEAVGKYKVKIKVVGKNLFGINNLTNGLSNGNFIAKEFNINGDSVTLTGGMAVLKFESNKNTDYHLSFTFKSNQNNDTPRVYIYDKYLNQIYFMNGSNVKFNSKNNDTLYIGLYIAMLNGYRGSYSNIQLEQGTNATPYESYKESIIEFYIDEPLRGIGDVKDKVYVKNDKVVVKRNCGSVTFDGSDDENLNFNRTLDNSIRFDVPYPNISTSRDYTIICNRFKYATDNSMDSILNHTSLSLFTFYIAKSKLQSQDTAGFKQWLQHNPTTVVYKLASPTYEEVEYSESRLFLDTYNNSTLFYESNIPVSNTSFKPLWEELVYLKNSTKYYIQFNSTASGTVVFNLGGTEVTKDIVEGYNNIAIDTPAETTNLLTIDGHGIKISEVVVSESVCGGHYLGLQSCFEEHMENGKYVCTIRGIALDGSKVSGIKLYLDEPLRGIENVKDRLCIKDGKLMVERKCGSTTFDGSNDEDIDEYRFENINSQTNTTAFLISEPKAKTAYNLNNFYCDKFKFLSNIWNEDQDYEGINENNFNKFIIRINRIKLQTQDIAGFRQYLQQNSTTVVYELIEPTYEEATNEYGLPIVFEGYENGIVYVDSAVTPTTHIKYTSNNVLATTLSEAEEQNIATQEDINMNVITYMMDIDMMLTDMEMNNDISVMAVRRDSSNENMLDRMSEEDKKVYRDNTVVMLEKMITAQALEKEDIERRVNMYYNKNRISKEQYNYLKSLL